MPVRLTCLMDDTVNQNAATLCPFSSIHFITKLLSFIKIVTFLILQGNEFLNPFTCSPIQVFIKLVIILFQQLSNKLNILLQHSIEFLKNRLS